MDAHFLDLLTAHLPVSLNVAIQRAGSERGPTNVFRGNMRSQGPHTQWLQGIQEKPNKTNRDSETPYKLWQPMLCLVSCKNTLNSYAISKLAREAPETRACPGFVSCCKFHFQHRQKCNARSPFSSKYVQYSCGNGDLRFTFWLGN